MDYRDWEQKIKEKLEASSPEEAGFSVNADSIWKHITTKNKPKQRDLFLFRPVVSHIAAGFLGILMSTLLYFLLFQHINPGKPATVSATIHEQRPITPEPQGRIPQSKDQPQGETALSDLHKLKPKTGLSKNIADNRPRESHKMASGTGVKPDIIKDTIHGFAATTPHQDPQQDETLITPKVVYWKDIENNYTHKSDPKYWATLVHRIDKRLEKSEKSENNKAPVITWIQTFK